jgi:MFS family permease
LKKLQFDYKWNVLMMGILAVFGALGLARFGYSMVLPTMQMDLGLDNRQAGLLATSNLAGYLILSIIGGALASRFGARIVASVGLLIAGAGMILTGWGQDFLSVAVWRALTGFGSGACNIAVMGMWSTWFVKQKRGMASGIAVSGSSIGLIFTGSFVPWMIKAYGQSAWRICWFTFGGIALLLAVGSYLILRNNPAEKGVEDKKTIQYTDVYLSSKVWYLGLIYTACGFSYIIYMTFFVKYLINNCGYTAAEAGKLFMMMGWFSVFCGVIWGKISDLIGRKNSLIILYLIHTAAFSLFAVNNSIYCYTISAVLFGFSAWSIPAVMAATCGDMLGPKLAPAALGFITLFFGIGQALGPVVGGVIADTTGSFSAAFLLASAVAFLGAVGSAHIST